MVAPTQVVKKQCSVNAKRITLQDRALPDQGEQGLSFSLSVPGNQVFNQLDITPIRKQGFELFLSRLKH